MLSQETVIAQAGTLQSSLTIKVAVQPELIGKDKSNIYRLGNGWQNRTATIDQLKEILLAPYAGFAVCGASLTTGNRKRVNYEQGQLLLFDFDENSLAQVHADPYLHNKITFGFTTPSHTPDAPRCKIGIVTDKPISSADIHEKIVSHIMQKIQTVTVDTTGKDATRFTFGNPGGQWAYYGNVLSVDSILEEIAKEAIASKPAIAPPAQPDNVLTFIEYNEIGLVKAIIAEAEAQGYHGRNGWINGTCLFPENHIGQTDNDPSAGINVLSGVLHCFACGKKSATQVAERLGIDWRQFYPSKKPFLERDEVGLPESVRFQLNDHKLTRIARLLDAYYMNGNPGGVLQSIDDIRAALGEYAQFFGKENSTTLYNILNQDAPLQWCDDLSEYRFKKLDADECRTKLFTEEGVFSEFYTLLKGKEYKVKNMKKPNGGRPATRYYMPTITEILSLFGWDDMNYSPFPVSALADNKSYRLAYAERDTKRRGVTDNMAIKDYAKHWGVCKSTALNYMRDSDSIFKQGNPPRLVTRVKRGQFLPEYDAGYYWLQIKGSDHKWSYIPEHAAELFKKHHEIEVYAPSYCTIGHIDNLCDDVFNKLVQKVAKDNAA